MKFFKNLENRPAHVRRRNAMQISGALMAVIFVGWVTTLGVRLQGGLATSSSDNTSSSGLVAATAEASGAIASQIQNFASSVRAITSGVSAENPAPLAAPVSAPATVLSGAPVDQATTTSSYFDNSSAGQ